MKGLSPAARSSAKGAPFGDDAEAEPPGRQSGVRLVQVVAATAVGHDDRGQTGQSQLGEHRPAGAADEEVGLAGEVGQLVDVGDDDRAEAGFAVSTLGLGQPAGARLVDDLPTGSRGAKGARALRARLR